MKKIRKFVACLCVFLMGVNVNCRSDDNMGMTPGRLQTSGGYDTPDWSSQDVEVIPQEQEVEMPIVDVRPREYFEYTTDVMINGGCAINPLDMAVAKGHKKPALCEHIIGIPARNDDGDFYEVSATFVWDVIDSETVDIPCIYKDNDGFCHAVGKQDIFDTDGDHEPQTGIMACAVNACPEPRPKDCLDMVCASTTVVSVINIEGMWILSGDFQEIPVFAHPLQDGRLFQDDATGMENGVVDGTSIHFEIGDYFFKGNFGDHRKYLNGQVWEMMTGTLMGEWSVQIVSS